MGVPVFPQKTSKAAKILNSEVWRTRFYSHPNLHIAAPDLLYQCPGILCGLQMKRKLLRALKKYKSFRNLTVRKKLIKKNVESDPRR